MAPVGDPKLMERVVNLAKRRGLVFPSSEIYGGFRSTWDYGPLGVLLKRNVKEAWWRAMVQLRDDVVGLDAAILMAPKVWEASGHIATFTDPLVDCRNCKERFRADQLPESGACPNCGMKDTFTEARNFNLMFKTFVGPVEDDSSVAYLRPETAQGIFVNFKNVQTTTRKKPPFGIAQIGKSFRNEITPGNFVFRTREFEQMEMEYFVPPDQAAQWYEYWVAERYRWYTDLGIPDAKLRIRPHDPEELSHYSAGTSDVEFEYPWGWGELEGIANRTDYDLTQHAKFSGEDLSYFDQENDERYLPYVIEPAAGADRATLAFLLAAYDEDEAPTGEGKVEKRTVLRLDPRLAPIKVAVLPLSKKDTLLPLTDDVARALRPHFMIDVDLSGAIGRRYRRQDEIGTPLCVTIDFDTIDDRAVTVRDRDSMAQERVPLDRLVGELRDRLGVNTMDDYYSLLGIEADATVDDIRGAYRVRKDGLDTGSEAGRADAVKLNKAWNVLSDPYQRGRYDEQRATAADDGTLGVDDPADDTKSKPSSNGSDSKGLRATARNSRQARQESVREARAERLKNAATIAPPAGTRWPTTKERIIAMVIDLFVIIVLVSASQIAASAIAKSQKPDVVKQVDSYNTQINDGNKAKSDADKLVSDDKKANNTAKQAIDQKTSDDAKANVTALTKKRDDEEQKLAPYFITGIAVAFFLGFLYLAIPTARTGRTLGKRFQHLKVLREDGSPLGLRGAVVRWGSVVLVTFVLYYVLQQIAAVVVLFGVTLWMRNANKQGLHDRFAHTIVVSDAAD